MHAPAEVSDVPVVDDIEAIVPDIESASDNESVPDGEDSTVTWIINRVRTRGLADKMRLLAPAMAELYDEAPTEQRIDTFLNKFNRVLSYNERTWISKMFAAPSGRVYGVSSASKQEYLSLRKLFRELVV